MTISIIGNLGKREVTEAVSAFSKKLDAVGIDYLIEEGVAAYLLSAGYPVAQEKTASLEKCIIRGDMLAAFGGDGTILSASKAVAADSMPILGINLGKLGFLAEIAPAEMDAAIDDLLKGKYIVEERTVLQGESEQLNGKIFHAVNDIVLAKGRSSRMIDLSTYIDGIFAVTYRGDGLILSTPTGSTAYALSSGGPIVTPSSRVFGLTPISPHTLSGRPLIVPDSSAITIHTDLDEQEVLISSDGQEEALLTSPFDLQIRKADHSLRLVKLSSGSYFGVLRAKLLWGRDPRSV